MTIDNVKVNGSPTGAFLSGKHGTANDLDPNGVQRALTRPYGFEGYRDAAFPTLAFLLAYVGRHGDVTPIKTFEFDVVDETGALVQRVTMEDCVVTAWRLEGAAPPADGTPAAPDREFVRLESTRVKPFAAGGETPDYVRTDPNAG